MKSRFMILSHPVDTDTPLYGNTPKPEITPIKSIGNGDSSDTYMINICNHSSTHVDAPSHFVHGGRRISDYSIDELTFKNPIIIDIPKKEGDWIEKEDLKGLNFSNNDCILFKTGFGKYRTNDVYRLNNPGIAPEVIIFIRKNFHTVSCLGLDSISISGFKNRERGRESHKVAFKKDEQFGKPLLVIEDMDLNPVKENKLRQIVVIPWFIKKIDSAPCTVLAEVV